MLRYFDIVVVDNAFIVLTLHYFHLALIFVAPFNVTLFHYFTI